MRASPSTRRARYMSAEHIYGAKGFRAGVEQSDKNKAARPTTRRAALHQEQFVLNQGLKGKAVWSEILSRQKQTRKAVRQQDGLLFSRENSSNGVSEKTIRTF